MKKKLSHSEAGKLGAIASADAHHQKRLNNIEEYNKSPKLCKFCEIILSYDKRYNDFCSRSCGAKFNNSKRERSPSKKLEQCLFCLVPLINNQNKYCSRKCDKAHKWQIRKDQMILEGIDNSWNNADGKRYLIELSEGKCQECGLSEWQNQSMPLVLDHIDGNPYNDALSNLRVICNNCDALSSTFKGRNKGSGRFKRAERYKYEKDTVGDIDGFRWKQ